MKISIVMAYYNRRNLLLKTLESISVTRHKDYEIVIVDDASNDEHRIDDLANLNTKVVRIEKKDKWWINPCIPNNVGFAFASGDAVIIQNPECLHVGDIIDYVAENIILNKYIVFGCYAINYDKTQLISKISANSIEAVYGVINPINNLPMNTSPGSNSWYQHSKFSTHCLNFCTSLIKQDLEDLGGFDESFAHGLGCDDTEFLYRIRRKGMQIDMVDNPFVVHQYHKPTDYSNKDQVALNHNLRLKALESFNIKVFNTRTKELVERMLKKNENINFSGNKTGTDKIIHNH